MPKFAVITGASSGIGAEFARQLSARGYNLMLVARRADRLEALSDQLTTVCEIVTADLSKKSECLRLAKALEDRRVDLFINNAGFGDCGPFLQTELDKDLDMLSVNIRAVHILTKKIVVIFHEFLQPFSRKISSLVLSSFCFPLVSAHSPVSLSNIPVFFNGIVTIIAMIVPPQVLIKNGTTNVNNAAALFPITRYAIG